MRMIGYARVSTDGQSVDQQRAALMAAGAVLVAAEQRSGIDPTPECPATRNRLPGARRRSLRHEGGSAGTEPEGFVEYLGRDHSQRRWVQGVGSTCTRHNRPLRQALAWHSGGNGRV